MRFVAAVPLLVLLAAGCARPSAPEPVTPPAPAREPAAAPPSLPPPPVVDGPLVLQVAYPPQGARLAVRDSNFIFGQTGSGRASLTINGTAVTVAPNGAFLAFLPVPPDGLYRLRAARGADTATAELQVAVPAPRAPTLVAATITSVAPSGALTVRAGEWVEVSVRGTPGARVYAVLPDGSRIPLVESGAPAASPDPGDDFRTSPAPRPSGPVLYRGVFSARESWSLADAQVARPRLAAVIERALAERAVAGPGVVSPAAPAAVPAGRDAATPGAAPGTGAAAAPSPRVSAPHVELVVGTDTVRSPLRLNLAVLPADLLLVGVASPPAGAAPDWTLRGRVDTSGPFHYFWAPGTRFHITGERSGFYRVRLAGNLHAYVPAPEVRLLPAGTPPPGSAIAAVRFNAAPEWVDLRVPLSEPLPYRVQQEERTLTLDVFGGISQANFFQYGSLDPLIRRAGWNQPADSVYRVTVELTEPVWGYEPRFEGNALVLRIRRPPRIDPERPLAGLRIAVDAGHPPAGAMGPTGLTEAEANLAVALRLQRLLAEKGAHVIMTRTDAQPVDLNARPRMAADSQAHVLISLHNNAFPDGVNPFTNNGTSVYYFQPHSVDLAQQLQAALLRELGLRDIGIGRADLALVRPSWMVAALSETMYMMVPEQEAALRNPDVQQRIAEAHLRGLVAFLRGRAAAQRR